MTTFRSDGGRDPRNDPRKGDVLRHHGFGPTGADFVVTRVGPGRRGTHRALVSCRVHGLGGVRLEQRGRVYALATWPDFMRDAEVVTVAPEPSA